MSTAVLCVIEPLSGQIKSVTPQAICEVDACWWDYLDNAATFQNAIASETSGTTICQLRSGHIFACQWLAIAPDAVVLALSDTSTAESKYRSLFEHALDGIFQTSPSGQYLDANPALARIYGYDSVAELMSGLEDIQHQLYVDPSRRLEFQHLMATDGQVVSFVSQVYRKDGSIIWISENARTVCDSTGQVLYYEGIVEDISEQKRMARLKDEFVSTVSHELRTPLTSIRGALGLLVGGMGGQIPPQAQTLLSMAHKNSERLVILINDILDIEKIEAGRMQFELKPWSLQDLVQQAIEANQTYADQYKVQLVLTQALPSELEVRVDQHRLMQVLTNLLSNAAKFSPAGGTVTIAITLVSGDRVCVSVADEGTGIPEAFRSQIFEKFAQADASTSRQKGGTGLGLSISKAIIEAMSGEIGFETSTAGSTFFFQLPIWHDVSKHLATSTTRPRILVVEDDRDIATLLQLMLQQSGYHVDVVYSAATAKQRLLSTTYVAMTLDLALPDQSGITLIQELRSQPQTRDLPIVVVSAMADQQDLQGGSVAVVDWISKPVDQGRLRQAVQQAMLHRQPGRPRILHIEDHPDVATLVSQLLAEAADVVTASSLAAARAALDNEGPFQLVILDLELPDGQGWQILPTLQQQHGPPVPVVVFSAYEVDRDALQDVAAALVKSQVSNQQIVDTIRALIPESGRS